MEWELLDWELLHGSDSESTDLITSDKKSGSPSVIDDGIILSDHFSVDNLTKISDPSQYRVEYGSNQWHNSGEVRVDSNSGHLDVCRSDNAGDGEARLSDFEAADEKHLESEAVTDLTGGTVSHYEDGSKFLSGSDHLEVANERHVEDLSNSWSDSGGNELVTGDSGVLNGAEEILSDSEASEGSGGNAVEVVAVNSAVRSGDGSENKETVWWKMPFVLLKYCAFRIGPVWSVSMAAAMMGLVLLGRRLYNMKKKAQRFNLKVTIDDKKVSQVMYQAARLNGMFTNVRRVPVIRPALPSPGAWPVLSLR